MKLSKRIAQKIVTEMMNVIPYNINVMDENGIILGSGDSSRIGKIHEGSINAIKNKNINEVYEDNDAMKAGVNAPIIVDNKIIGVIGITGDPEEVRRFSKLVCATAALLIDQIKLDEEIHNKRLSKERFYHELARRKTAYDDEFYEAAQSYGMDLSKTCRAIVVDGNFKNTDLKLLCERYHNFSEGKNRTVFFITDNYEYSMILKKLKAINDVHKISIGTEEEIAAYSCEKAELSYEYGIKIKPSNLIYSYEEFKIFINLEHKDKSLFTALISNLEKAGNKLELLETLQVYIEENSDINSVASKLKIHRNTLNYRLERINILTGKNPKNVLELFELICGLVWRK
ncbi:MAG: sugar diacid recognition domain-containing protein [Clostridium sp.]|nr:sugar diacid recognition domain-containing protein [Clostridium sp.]